MSQTYYLDEEVLDIDTILKHPDWRLYSRNGFGLKLVDGTIIYHVCIKGGEDILHLWVEKGSGWVRSVERFGGNSLVRFRRDFPAPWTHEEDYEGGDDDIVEVLRLIPMTDDEIRATWRAYDVVVAVQTGTEEKQLTVRVGGCSGSMDEYKKLALDVLAGHYPPDIAKAPKRVVSIQKVQLLDQVVQHNPAPAEEE